MRHLLLTTIVLCASVAGAAVAADLSTIRAMAKSGQFDVALVELNAILKDTPADPQARFLKGVILAEQGNSQGAIPIFQGLTQDYPELPEPHNNLAVLHAANGDYERARDALVVAIGTHPSYATAHENLGDIYAKMAGLAYGKALQLDTANQTAKSKLALVRELFSAQGHTAIAANSQPAVVPTLEPEPTPQPQPAEVESVPQPQMAKVEPTPQPQQPAPQPKLAAQSSESKVVDEVIQAEVLSTLTRWAEAWSNQDVDQYLSFYAPTFKPPKGQSRPRWENVRRGRLQKPAFVEVTFSNPTVKQPAANRATVTFTQSYRSNTYADQVVKNIALAWTGVDWKIVSEHTLR